MKINYPFLAIVGQEKMKTALILAVINPALGGVIIRGEKGTAKSTAVRAMADLLPNQEVIDGCKYGCDPFAPEKWCDECLEKYGKQNPEGHILPTKSRLRPLVELPIGATEDRLLGSLNLEKAMSSGESIFEPGLLAQANRGILYVDEVNLLDDFLVDVLLDAAAMGRNFVEREGISISHPALFTLIGTMNPEEGELRPQLLDRFGLCVEVKGLFDPFQRQEVVKERLLFEENPEKYYLAFKDKEKALGLQISQAQARLSDVILPESALHEAVKICLKLGVDGHRGDLTVVKAAITLAAWENREVSQDLVLKAAELALPHRMRRKPFQDVDFNVLERLESLLED
jgi:Mg-chelatase subunit ChlI